MIFLKFFRGAHDLSIFHAKANLCWTTIAKKNCGKMRVCVRVRLSEWRECWSHAHDTGGWDVDWPVILCWDAWNCCLHHPMQEWLQGYIHPY